MPNLIPKRLESGSTIVLTGSSNKIKFEEETLELVKDLLQKEFELEVRFNPTAHGSDKYGVSAGDPQQRAEEFNKLFTDPSVKAIWLARGGETANEMLDLINYNIIKKNPKILIGLSDNTVLINAIYHKTGLVTFHGPDPNIHIPQVYLNSNYSRKELQRVLFEGSAKQVEPTGVRKTLRKGVATGQTIGGNLKSLLKLAGTQYWPSTKGKILFLEAFRTEIRELLSQLTQLEQVGVFKQIHGIIIGSVFSFDNEKQFDKRGQRIYYEDIVLDKTHKYDFPILKIYEFGHRCENTFIPIGIECELDAETQTITYLGPYIQ